LKFTTAAAIEQVVWQMRLSDWPRARNRARLDELYNGFPPFTEEEQIQNRITTNVNFLEGLKILHDARRQFATAFNSSDQLFTVNVDAGPVYRKREWSAKITNTINRIIKRSRDYLNVRKSQFANTVLHGIGPTMWEDRERWCLYDLGVEDVLVPSNTLVSLRNLPFLAVYRQYTAAQLQDMTSGPRVDPAWNLPLVKKAISWVDEQARQLMGTTWPEVWSPEKLQERIKQDGGIYASDSAPTVDTFDVYFYDDDGKRAGWKRRIILDAWGSPGYGGAGGVDYSDTKPPDSVPDKTYLDTRNEFLYNPGNRVYADSLEQIIHFQFADASCVAPFRYHSVRSLGFLLYSVCHLQNRLRCKFNDHVFESLLQYFRVANPADAERAQKIDLVNFGVIPEGMDMIPANQRWQIQDAVIQQAMQLNRQTMADNSASFTQDFDFEKEKAGETATRTMAKVNATAALVGSMLNDAYNQAQFQYQEICRRFCIKNSKDPDVRKFRVECLKAGIPEEALNVERWDVQPVRVVGSGNKMLQVAMADKLMAIRPMVDPDAQKVIDRLYVLANSDDPALVQQIVPERRRISDSVHDAQTAVGTLLAGLPVSIEDGMNHKEYIEVWLASMATIIKKIQTRGNMATPDELTGLNNLAQHIGQHIQKLAEDKNEKANVKEYGDDLGKLMNEVKGFAQRLAEQQKQQQAQPQLDPKDAAKIQATMLTARTKAQLAKESHAQRTAQRQIQFEQQVNQDAVKHKAELAKTDLEAAANIKRGQLKSFTE
jgi:hypothetical protein